MSTKLILGIAVGTLLLAEAPTILEVTTDSETAEVLVQLKMATLSNARFFVLWCSLPGLIGGLIVQLIPDVLKGFRQLVGELLASTVAGFIFGVFIYEFQTNPFKLAAMCILAGVAGSAAILAWAKKYRNPGALLSPPL